MRFSSALSHSGSPIGRPIVSAPRISGVFVEGFAEELGEVVDALEHRSDLYDPVIHPGEMCPGARPSPASGSIDETGRHRVEAHVAHCVEEVNLVHHHRAVTPLPEVAGGSSSRVDKSGAATVQIGERASQSVLLGHSGIKVAMVYAHLVPENVVTEALDILNARPRMRAVV